MCDAADLLKKYDVGSADSANELNLFGRPMLCKGNVVAAGARQERGGVPSADHQCPIHGAMLDKVTEGAEFGSFATAERRIVHRRRRDDLS